jgi:hypothetical protein
LYLGIGMKNQKETIHKIVNLLNNSEADGGGFWLPSIQRPFVWREDQVCRLFDSILREYPISTLLIWRTTSPLRRRKFIDNWKEALRLGDFYVPEDEKKKCLVLDGQQRLQSLYIGLRGSFEGRELYFDIPSGETAAPDEIKYKFRFLDAANGSFPWIKFKDLVFTPKKPSALIESLRTAAGRELGGGELKRIEDHLWLVNKTFRTDDSVVYQELDSIDDPDRYAEDDVVEVFIRANSGGTRLGKSDLLFSLLAVHWPVADEEMGGLLWSLNQHGFDFDRDFVLKTALTLLDQGARYEVGKFRRAGIREAVESQWSRISSAIRYVLDFVRTKTFIQCDKQLPSHLVLIPLIYFRYHFPDAWEKAQGSMSTDLLRCSLAGAYGAQPDNLLDALVRKIQEMRGFCWDAVFEVIRSQRRSLEITEDDLWQMGYGSKNIHLLFSLWYAGFNYKPAHHGNSPQVDHIFPQSLLKGVKTVNPKTEKKDLLKYHEADRNQLANCMLLTQDNNGFEGKNDQHPDKWFPKQDKAYLKMHLIPEDPGLWNKDRFEDFIAARKKLIREKFSYLLVGTN